MAKSEMTVRLSWKWWVDPFIVVMFWIAYPLSIFMPLGWLLDFIGWVMGRYGLKTEVI